MSAEDIAQEREAFDWELNNRPRAAAPTFKPEEKGYGPATCTGRAAPPKEGDDREDDCGEEMPPERRAMGKHLCISCQLLSERGRLGR